MGVFEHWPNRITGLRFLGACGLFVLLATICARPQEDVSEARWAFQLAFWLFALTAATDYLDGFLARRNSHVSAFGRIADPFVDKVLIVGALVFLAVLPWSAPYLPAWMVVVILAREFLVTAIRGYVESLGQSFPADRFGKLKMLVQCFAVGDLLWLQAFAWEERLWQFWSGLGHALVWASLITTLGSGISYVVKTANLLAREEK